LWVVISFGILLHMTINRLTYEPVLLAVFLLSCSGGSLGTGRGGSSGGVGTPTGGAAGTAGAGGNGGGAGAVISGGTGGFRCPNSTCADESLLCNQDAGRCVRCLTNANCSGGNPGYICLPDGNCGCNDDSQCSGEAAIRCIPTLMLCGCNTDADCTNPRFHVCGWNHSCGCSSNQDCAGDGGVGTTPVCDPSTGSCVACLTDADCTDPNNRACASSLKRCFPCRTSADCAQNAAGAVCEDFGGDGVGECHCDTDSDCAGRPAALHCLSNGGTYNECGCLTGADCASDARGHACLDPNQHGWFQCGCATTGDCPSGKTCPAYGAACQ
jgi:hypothetical protein